MKIFLFLLASSIAVGPGFGFVTLHHPTGAFMRKQNLVSLYETADDAPKEKVKPIILEPCIEAMAPDYSVNGPVGGGEFLISRTGGPTDDELKDENLYKIIERKASDLEVNTLVWKALGYRFDAEANQWTAAEVFPKWKERFPEPPDVIGMKRVYSKEVDGPCLKNNQALVKSIPVDNKKSYLKEYMKPFGFTGYKVSKAVDNKNYFIRHVLDFF